MNKHNGLTVFEVLVAFMIVLVVSYFSVPKYKEVIKRSKEVVLTKELQILRQGIYAYFVKYNKLPNNLRDLEEKKMLSFEKVLSTKEIKKYYLKNKNGDILDPFGNPYFYDDKVGEVYSLTKGYKDE